MKAAVTIAIVPRAAFSKSSCDTLADRIEQTAAPRDRATMRDARAMKARDTGVARADKIEAAGANVSAMSQQRRCASRQPGGGSLTPLPRRHARPGRTESVRR
ncbi:hypothetical protein HRV97_14270 [Sphingomonas sp. HHU CXW]|uniref:Uncharacterized protein n=1 Tax=Sphingomonas hominis TaxID=2741495 RepID=A0ABX2JIS6_9SPHN|nr:hypothetical protein [Sphingomonas hominis]NTS66323.1 hypothetical protein [Sphingomonas hominis]